MNGRFVELAYQSKLFDGTGSVPFKDVEKFAELIVKECADYIDAFNRENMVEEGMDGAYMKKHFGVEE